MRNILFLILIVSGCSSSSVAPYIPDWQLTLDSENKVELLNYPKLNTVTEAKLGNTLVSKSLISYEPVLKINESFSYGYNNSMKVYIESRSSIFLPFKNTLKNNSTGDTLKCYENTYEKNPLFDGWFDLCTDKNGYIKYRSQWAKTPYIIYGEFKTMAYDTNGYKEIIPFEATFEETTKISKSETNFKQEFIYNGRVNNSLKFIYREFTGDLARQSFSQEIQYDLNQSNTIGFKDLSIEILKATNQQIEYRVITPF